MFDTDGTGHIGVGQLRYVLTNLGEKLSDQEVDELLAGVKVGGDGTIDYRSFVREVSRNAKSFGFLRCIDCTCFLPLNGRSWPHERC